MIHLQNITFGYTDIPVFDDITCDLPNACYCFGPNGSGKTSLIQLIAGVLKPTSGTITLNAQTDWRTSIFLNHDILFDELTIQTHLDWIHQMYGHHRDIEELFGIEQYATRYPGKLSSGEKQWCALCMTFCMPCDILLIDEPMRSLDADKCTKFLEILRGFAQKHNVMVTGHQQNDDLALFLSPVCISQL